MNEWTDSSTGRSAELLRFALERAAALSASPPAERSTARWAYEAASLGDISTLAALAILNDPLPA